MCKPGVAYQTLGARIEEIATRYGFQSNKTYSGHGINQCVGSSFSLSCGCRRRRVATRWPAYREIGGLSSLSSRRLFHAPAPNVFVRPSSLPLVISSIP